MNTRVSFGSAAPGDRQGVGGASPCDEGVANHIGPESCAGIARCDGEALTGVRAGQPLSRDKNSDPGCRRCPIWRKATRRERAIASARRPGVVVEPGMHARSLHGNREISGLTAGAGHGRLARIGKARSRSR